MSAIETKLAQQIAVGDTFRESPRHPWRTVKAVLQSHNLGSWDECRGTGFPRVETTDGDVVMLIRGARYPVCQAGDVPADRRTTIWTKWGDDVVAVSADWSDASCRIEGDSRGRQVADFHHHPNAALQAAVEDAARADGLPLEYYRLQISRAMSKAKQEDHYVLAHHAR